VKLSIVIPTLNRCAMLARTLPHALNQDLPPGEYEVVVVCDGSTDGTAEFVRSIRSSVALRVIERPHRGLAAARNAGIEAARGELVLLLDDDMFGQPTFAARHIAAHNDGFDGIVIGPLRSAPESRSGLATELVRRSHNEYHDQLAGQGPMRSAYKIWLAANFSAPRNLLLNHRGYDERFSSSEDQEFAIRLWNAGVQFRFLPDAPVYEIYSKSAGQAVASDAPRTGKADVQLARKHGGYRRASILASLIGESRAKLMLWSLCCIPPISPDLALRVPCSMAESLSANSRIEQIGLRVFQYRRAIAIMRGAMREAGSWQALRREFGMRLPVLRYARIESAQSFQAQVRWLARRGYAAIAPSQWLAWIRRGEALPDRPVLISFDCAYAELAESALPILLRHGFRAAVHVVTAEIGGTSQWDRESGIGPQPLMTAAQIRYWAEKGIEFGSHGRRLRHLSGLEADRLADEIEGSAADLTRVLGRPPLSFLYPGGAVNDAILDCVRRSFEMAMGDQPGLNALCTDLYRMHTTAIRSDHRIGNLALAVELGRVSLRARNPVVVNAVSSPRTQPVLGHSCKLRSNEHAGVR